MVLSEEQVMELAELLLTKSEQKEVVWLRDGSSSFRVNLHNSFIVTVAILPDGVEIRFAAANAPGLVLGVAKGSDDRLTRLVAAIEQSVEQKAAALVQSIIACIKAPGTVGDSLKFVSLPPIPEPPSEAQKAAVLAKLVGRWEYRSYAQYVETVEIGPDGVMSVDGEPRFKLSVIACDKPDDTATKAEIAKNSYSGAGRRSTVELLDFSNPCLLKGTETCSRMPVKYTKVK